MNFLERTTLATIVATSLLASPTRSQERASPGKAYAANALFHGLVAGIGSAMNEKNVLEGFAQGVCAGLVVALGKQAVGEDIRMAWPAKILVATGTSVTYNVARGWDAFSTIGMDFGPLYFEIDAGNGKPKFKPYLNPDATYWLIDAISRGHRFDSGESMRYGTPVFYTKRYKGNQGNVIANVIKMQPADERLTTVRRHENIHVLQNSQVYCVNALFRNIGFIDDAEDLVESLHMKPDFTAWGLRYVQARTPHDRRLTEIEAASFANPAELRGNY